jgi:hypothetical protein
MQPGKWYAKLPGCKLRFITQTALPANGGNVFYFKSGMSKISFQNQGFR